jgi:pantothenate kinase-related protein Tda10
MNASSLDMWKACDFYAKFDKAMPSSLKMHLIDLEASYLTHKLWKESPNLEMIARIARGEKDREAYSSRSEFGDRLFRKLLVQTAFQINQLASSLGLEEFLT